MKLAINQATLMKTPMDTFLKVVSAAGFEGVELRRDQTFEFLNSNSVQDLNRLLERSRLECITFNAIELFSLCPETEFKRILVYTERLMEIGTRIGCNKIIAVPSFIEENSMTEEKIMSQTVERLKIITDIAEDYSFKVDFEPLGFVNCSVRKLDFALKIIQDESLPKIDLVIDTFHYFLGGHDPKNIQEIKVQNIGLIHINDSIEKPLNQLQDSDRVLPDEGFFQLKEFMENLKNIQYDGWLSLELFNEKMWELDPFAVTEKSMDAIKKFL